MFITLSQNWYNVCVFTFAELILYTRHKIYTNFHCGPIILDSEVKIITRELNCPLKIQRFLRHETMSLTIPSITIQIRWTFHFVLIQIMTWLSQKIAYITTAVLAYRMVSVVPIWSPETELPQLFHRFWIMNENLLLKWTSETRCTTYFHLRFISYRNFILLYFQFWALIAQTCSCVDIMLLKFILCPCNVMALFLKLSWTGPGIAWWRHAMETFSALLALCEAVSFATRLSTTTTSVTTMQHTFYAACT